jgi:hypothetical protein
VSWLIAGIGAVCILFGAIHLVAVISYDKSWVGRFRLWREAEAQKTREAGYKVNMFAVFAWIWRTRLRLTLFGLAYVAFGLWWVLAALEPWRT